MKLMNRKITVRNTQKNKRKIVVEIECNESESSK